MIGKQRIFLIALLVEFELAKKVGNEGLVSDYCFLIALLEASGESHADFYTEKLESLLSNLFFKEYWNLIEEMLRRNWATFQELIDFLDSFNGNDKYELPAYMAKFRCYDVRSHIARDVGFLYEKSPQKGGKPTAYNRGEVIEALKKLVSESPDPKKGEVFSWQSDLKNDYDVPERSFYRILDEVKLLLARGSFADYMQRMGIE